MSQYRTYEFVVYQQPHVQGKGINVPNTTIRDVKKAVAFAKQHVGRGAGIYSITKGRFVGWINPNGRFVSFR